MTENKRFEHKWNMLGMQFICYDCKDVLLGTFADKEGVEHIVDLLNELNDENQRITSLLQSERRELIEQNNNYRKLLNDLNDENKQLKQAISDWKGSYDELYQDIEILEKENEQLKSELKIYRKVANCSNCKYQNYDWFDDGDEFEICERGNNEQQISYHICKDWREL